MSPRAAQVSAVLQSLSEHSLSLPDFLLYILLTKESLFEPQQAQLASQTWEILDAWSCLLPSSQVLRRWVHQVAKAIYTDQVKRLTPSDVGFQFNAANASMSQIEIFSMNTLESRILEHAPDLADLVAALLVSDKALENGRVRLEEGEDDGQEIGDEEGEDEEQENGDAEEIREQPHIPPHDDEEELWTGFGTLSFEDLGLNEFSFSAVDCESDPESSGEGLTALQRK
ncbi:hypothetical protein M422DRAFT_262708 [Sphaerobolus stellatus SS14]|uniref:Unplaced genomic scaffold SPHSTscaffold_117, whole genome shotgun sequence n=1 Tax=Sphaerobolus stellatus (strain SS14) TaxID=990650 RepID=A0A0C9VCQ6_SPHS4|nr:hypothetical protein M422DRAFT_262708 [Sphaerobolus stellatus SS14]